MWGYDETDADAVAEMEGEIRDLKHSIVSLERHLEESQKKMFPKPVYYYALWFVLPFILGVVLTPYLSAILAPYMMAANLYAQGVYFWLVYGLIFGLASCVQGFLVCIFQHFFRENKRS